MRFDYDIIVSCHSRKVIAKKIPKDSENRFNYTDYLFILQQYSFIFLLKEFAGAVIMVSMQYYSRAIC